MEKKKVNFFKRIKDAVVNFDEYKVFAEEELSVTIKFILKLVILFAVITTICLVIFGITKANNIREKLYKNLPEFKFENNNLILEGDTKQFIETDSNQYFKLIIDSEKEDLKDIEDIDNYKIMAIAFLKDKVVLKNAYKTEYILYEQLNENIDLNNTNKEVLYEATQSNKLIILFLSAAVLVIIFVIVYLFIKLMFDILVLTLIGFLFSRIVGVNFKYKSIFNICTYSLVLSLILNLIYICVKLFTGFEIRYFDIAYNSISYIYIITAMLLIKSDLIKQKIEVQKIIEVQKEVRKELQQKREEEKKKKEEDKKQDKGKDKEKKKQEKENSNGEPQGNGA